MLSAQYFVQAYKKNWSQAVCSLPYQHTEPVDNLWMYIAQEDTEVHGSR